MSEASPAAATVTIDEVNALDRDGFVAMFGHVYEATPALAARAWELRPFGDRAALAAAFGAVADQLDDDAVLSLLQAHPQLGSRVPMTSDSQDEQRSAGLTALDERRQREIADGNARYLERFGFPFIIAVRGLQPSDIAAALATRLEHDQATELTHARREVKRIAELRICQLVEP